MIRVKNICVVSLAAAALLIGPLTGFSQDAQNQAKPVAENNQSASVAPGEGRLAGELSEITERSRAEGCAILSPQAMAREGVPQAIESSSAALPPALETTEGAVPEALQVSDCAPFSQAGK